MTVASRFAKLLATSIDPQDYHAITTGAEQRVKTLHDCIMEIAEAYLDKEAFRALKADAEEREAQAIKDAEARQRCRPAPPTPTQPAPAATHVQTRMAERYSLDVTKKDIRDIEDLILAKSPAVKLIRQTATISMHYEVQVKGKRVQVVYDPKKNCVLTALPMKTHQKSATKRGERGGPKRAAWRLEDEDAA